MSSLIAIFYLTFLTFFYLKKNKNNIHNNLKEEMVKYILKLNAYVKCHLCSCIMYCVDSDLDPSYFPRGSR